MESGAAPEEPGSVLAVMVKHSALVLTAGYFAATAVGMLSSWTFYQRFGINIFDFTQVSDFLLASLRQPLATLAILAAAPAVWLLMKVDDAFDRRYRWYKYIYGPKRLRDLGRTPLALVIYVALYSFTFSIVSTGHLADRVRSGSTRVVEVQLLGGHYLDGDEGSPFQASLLGTTTAFVFLYDPTSERVTVVPVENLAMLSVD